ncbi:MAG TPA: rod shape-determining protein RodA [Polyangiaceae bacterium]|nr:rod shape-determining protein RodA [Polyangiaceae bacterium]
MARSMFSSRGGPHIDMPLLLVVVAIASVGVVNLYSATSAYVGAARHGGLAGIYVTQIYWIVVGLLLAMLVAAIDYRHFERLAPIAYVGGLLMLCSVFVLATDVRGSARWIRLGSFTFQPSEFMKPALVLMMARYIQNDSKVEPRTLLDLALPLFVTAVPVGLVMLQPDLGTSLIYLMSALSMLAILRIRPASVLWGSFWSVVATLVMWNFGMKDYQKARITSFLDPLKDKQGTGWHAFQAQTAIGNGGLTGEGFMQGTQNQFRLLPDQHSDFPFAVFAEEFGFVGCVGLLILYGFLSIWAVHIASQAKDRFGAALAIGSGAVLFWHAVFNLGMSMGVLPVVGVTLPLFSYGGSSLVSMLICCGLLMSVSMRRTGI